MNHCIIIQGPPKPSKTLFWYLKTMVFEDDLTCVFIGSQSFRIWSWTSGYGLGFLKGMRLMSPMCLPHACCKFSTEIKVVLPLETFKTMDFGTSHFGVPVDLFWLFAFCILLATGEAARRGRGWLLDGVLCCSLHFSSAWPSLIGKQYLFRNIEIFGFWAFYWCFWVVRLLVVLFESFSTKASFVCNCRPHLWGAWKSDDCWPISFWNMPHALLLGWPNNRTFSERKSMFTHKAHRDFWTGSSHTNRAHVALLHSYKTCLKHFGFHPL